MAMENTSKGKIQLFFYWPSHSSLIYFKKSLSFENNTIEHRE